jgi:hypothetical protein
VGILRFDAPVFIAFFFLGSEIPFAARPDEPRVDIVPQSF